jgi:chromosome segregation ATPase
MERLRGEEAGLRASLAAALDEVAAGKTLLAEAVAKHDAEASTLRGQLSASQGEAAERKKEVEVLQGRMQQLTADVALHTELSRAAESKYQMQLQVRGRHDVTIAVAAPATCVVLLCVSLPAVAHAPSSFLALDV